MPTPSYVTPHTLGEAVAAAAVDGATILGGGTIVMAQKARGEIDASRFIDLTLVEELSRVTETAAGILVGSVVTYATLLRGTDPVVPLLPVVSRGITGGPQIRAQGTIGGSACYANPASDMPAALVALGATMLLDGPEGRRAVPVADFFRDAFRSDLRRGELLAGMEIPRRTEVRWGYAKLKASESSWPIITAAARLEMAGGERLAVVSVGGAAGIPVTVVLPWPDGRDRAEQRDRVLVDDQLAARVGTWWEDELADSRYRRRVAAVIATRAVEAALAEGGN
jgi:aerobic carbon-monoxide dehydrogenase medium subunit